MLRFLKEISTKNHSKIGRFPRLKGGVTFQWRQLNAMSVRLRRYVIARPVGSKQSRLNAGLLRCVASRNDVFVKLTPLGDLLLKHALLHSSLHLPHWQKHNFPKQD